MNGRGKAYQVYAMRDACVYVSARLRPCVIEVTWAAPCRYICYSPSPLPFLPILPSLPNHNRTHITLNAIYTAYSPPFSSSSAPAPPKLSSPSPPPPPTGAALFRALPPSLPSSRRLTSSIPTIPTFLISISIPTVRLRTRRRSGEREEWEGRGGWRAGEDGPYSWLGI